jgi:hypothetical protein
LATKDDSEFTFSKTVKDPAASEASFLSVFSDIYVNSLRKTRQFEGYAWKHPNLFFHNFIDANFRRSYVTNLVTQSNMQRL